LTSFFPPVSLVALVFQINVVIQLRTIAIRHEVNPNRENQGIPETYGVSMFVRI
jgi:hypothetical protein